MESIAYESRVAGVESMVVEDAFTDDDDAVFVVIPRLYFTVVPRAAWPTPQLLARTFALTVEQPGTVEFEVSAEQARRCPGTIAFSRDSASALTRRAQPASLFQLGYTEYNDVWRGEGAARAVDISYLGSTDAKCDALLAGYSQFWWERDVRLEMHGHDLETQYGSDVLSDRRTAKLLRDSRLYLNLHHAESRTLSSARVLNAMTNGAVVFTEHSLDALPFVSGEQFISASAASLGILTADALDDEDYLANLRGNAYDFIREHMRLSTSVEMFLEQAELLLGHPGVVRDPDAVADPPRPGVSLPAWAMPALTEEDHEISEVLKRDGAENEVAFESPAFKQASPLVSVIIPTFNMAPCLGDALASVAASRDVDYEILVHDDGSQLSSAAVVESFIDQHPGTAISFVGTIANNGVAAARNALLQRARGRLLFSLDADNGVYPTALQKLQVAMDSDPDASFAYSVIAVFNNGTPKSLLSARPWDPSLFRYGNYLDNMAMYRTSELRALGGWDVDLLNWEDFQLWLRMAENGMRGVFVPQILSWYRVLAQSRSQLAHLQLKQIWSEMRAAAPTVLAD
jgi:hypothetical protein